MHMIGPLERRRVNFPARSFKHAYSSIVISFPEIALDFAATNRLPAMYEMRDFVDEGGLMTYGLSSSTVWGVFPPMWTKHEGNQAC